jgi:hypothetical protein
VLSQESPAEERDERRSEHQEATERQQTDLADGSGRTTAGSDPT